MNIRVALPALGFLAIVALAGCQRPGQPGPMQRAGAAMDQDVINAQSNLGRASEVTGQALDRAGRAVGGAANRTGKYLQDKLSPGPAQPPTAIVSPPAPRASPENGAPAPAAATP